MIKPTNCNPERRPLDLGKRRQEEDHQDLAQLVSGHHVGRVLLLDLELLLDGRQDARHVHKEHPLARQKQINEETMEPLSRTNLCRVK